MTNPVAISKLYTQIVVLKYCVSIRETKAFGEKWFIPGLRKKNYKMNLKYIFKTDSKKATRVMSK